jgi:hypothetical protein
MELQIGDSLITCAGLDDAERVDKILGREYAGAYINESQDVPWATVKKLRTRLSQKIGFAPKLVADLNPTTTAHWTYKLWIDGQTPEGHPVLGHYASLWMSPYDNEINLAPGYIQAQLETLTGQYRARFLDGKYSNDSDLRVFNPRAYYSDSDLATWERLVPGSVRLVGGLDIGYADRDAFVMLAYVEGQPDIWLVYEHKANRQTISDLANAIRAGMMWGKSRFPAAMTGFEIYSDTADVLYKDPSGAAQIKSMRDLSTTFGLPIRAAYKRDKAMGIDYLQDDVNAGRLHIRHDGPFADECGKTVWKRDPQTEAVVRIIDDDTYHPDEMDSIIYAYRYLMRIGNSAMIGRVPVQIQAAEETADEMALAISGDNYVW